jgi:hypothetical protein
VTQYVPPGWPAGVHPPGSEEFERSAIAWLLEVVPSDYLLHGVLRRHPVALATLARHHLQACVDGARSGYRTARTELGPHLPPSAIEAVLTAYRNEGQRLAAAAQAAELVERALHGEVFVRQTSGGARSVAPSGSRRRGSTEKAKDPGAHRKPDATGTP